MPKHLHVGGLVAAGFDPTGAFLLTVSHSGRGLFSASTWERLARDDALAYPENGRAIGIGPLAGQSIAVVEKNNETGELALLAPNGAYALVYESGVLTISGPGC